MKTKKVVFYLLAVALGGCLPLSSLHPLYTDEQLIFEEKLVGKWSGTNDRNIWEFRQNGEKAYKLRILEEGKEGLFEAHLVQLEDMMFLDIFPDDATLDNVQDFYKIHILPMHTFAKIEQMDPNLVLQIMDLDKVREILKSDPNLMKHEVLDGNNIILTAATQDLQKFVIEYAGTEGVFGGARVFSRCEPLYTDEDVIFDEKLIGEWQGKDGEILNSIQAGEKGYDIIFVDKNGTEHRFVANLVNLNGSMLLATFFGEPYSEEQDPYGLHLTPDYFVLVEQIEPKLLLRNMDYEEIVEMLKDGHTPLEQESEKAEYAFEGFRVQL
jgi:hypothetical protein